MATLALQQPNYRKNRYHGEREFVGGIEQKLYYKEAAAQAWPAAAFVYQASGKIAIVSAMDGTQFLLGQALRAASGVTDNIVENLAIVRPGDQFFMNAYSATAADAVTALTDLGLRHRLIIAGSGATSTYHVDYTAAGSQGVTIEDATHAYPWVKVIGFHPEDTIGDTYARVLVEFGMITIATDGSPQLTYLQGAG